MRAEAAEYKGAEYRVNEPDLVGCAAMSSAEHPEVAGFRFAAVASGIKAQNRPDLGLIAADADAVIAAVLTKNRVKAAPVIVAAERLERGRARALLVNSGNANACTGKRGIAAARETTAAVADALSVEEALVIPASTGVIGEPLPAEKIRDAVPVLIERLAPDAASRFAEAILTTDRWPKMASVQIQVGGKRTATVLGIAKGAGMIHPNMATTLAFVLTDAPASSSFLRKSLRRATDETFNAISVDGDTSTNDAIFVLASGRVDAPNLRGEDRDARKFRDALRDVLGELGRSIVRDGEGAERLVTIEVVGSTSEEAARKVAETVSRSLLVKTALHGADPNWGRILAAAGNAGVAFDPDKVELRFDDIVVVRRGVAVGPGAEQDARVVMRRPEYTIRLKLGPGKARARYLTCDLGPEYVRINAAYRS